MQLKSENSSKTYFIRRNWLAPEILQIPPLYTELSDIYSFGILIWHLCHPDSYRALLVLTGQRD